MKLYLVRHGKTEDDANNTRQSMSSELGELGKKQAQAIAERLSHEKFDVIFSSNWARAHSTAKAISEKINLPITIDKRLREQGTNPIIDTLSHDHELSKAYKAEALIEGRKSMHWKFKGEGESMKEVLDRVNNFKEFLEKNYIGKNVLVVSHGAFISALIPSIFMEGFATSEIIWRASFSFRRQENTGLTLLVKVPDRDEWSLRYFNDASHLTTI
ncbi:MAG TPA: histidine phosphatase family protein [Candidatus Saccharimonadales bacterium]|nr:histidine phosphatase family protein [Candidatus Saccharimonadales bacterium]